MAALLDSILGEYNCTIKNTSSTIEEIKGKGWFVAKPYPCYYNGIFRLWRRVLDAYLVLTNKAFAVQYARDYFKNRKEA